MNSDDTIVAISTPAGRGGLGVVRLSGADALEIVLQVARAPVHRPTGESPSAPLALKPWRATVAELADQNGELVDRVVVIYFRKPRSYTGEDMVEIGCHGSPVVLDFVVARSLDAGARLAEPGEFTWRAFLNGRMDLTQAEAVRDLIEAQTLYQAKIASQQIDGAVSHRISPLKRQLVDLIAVLEAGIDFAEDDVSVLPSGEIARRLEPVNAGLQRIAESFRTGKIIRHGLTLAIVGRPNVGKSSLFNCLLQQDRAIVTATPGTTRDLVSETIAVEGVPLRFVDTAGIRQAFEEAEAIGIRKSYEAAADSDLALLVLDAAEGITGDDRELLAKLCNLGKLLVVVNKCDLPFPCREEDILSEIARQKQAAGISSQRSREIPVLFVSALQQRGIEELRKTIVHIALPALAGARESQFLTNVRQERLIQESLLALAAARESLHGGVPHEMLLLDLYNALRPLDAITGETTIEDILTQIFSTFCIGK